VSARKFPNMVKVLHLLISSFFPSIVSHLKYKTYEWWNCPNAYKKL